MNCYFEQLSTHQKYFFERKKSYEKNFWKLFLTLSAARGAFEFEMAFLQIWEEILRSNLYAGSDSKLLSYLSFLSHRKARAWKASWASVQNNGRTFSRWPEDSLQGSWWWWFDDSFLSSLTIRRRKNNFKPVFLHLRDRKESDNFIQVVVSPSDVNTPLFGSSYPSRKIIFKRYVKIQLTLCGKNAATRNFSTKI